MTEIGPHPSGPGWVERTDEEQIEALNSRVVELLRKLTAVVKVVDDKLAQYEDIENSRGGLTELGKHAQMSVRLLRQDIEYALHRGASPNE